MNKQTILNTKRVRMHLQCAIAHMKFCEDFDLLSENEQNMIKSAIFDSDIIDSSLGKHIRNFELKFLSQDTDNSDV